MARGGSYEGLLALRLAVGFLLMSFPYVNAETRIHLFPSGGQPGCQAGEHEMEPAVFVAQVKAGRTKLLKGCDALIFFEGDITASSMQSLISMIDAATTLNSYGGVAVSLHSPGGDIDAALKFGAWFRNKHLTGVHMEVPETRRCFSSCVFLLAAGFLRNPVGEIGIHRPYLSGTTARSLGYKDLKKAYDGLLLRSRAFLRSVNIEEGLADEMWRTPSHELRILNADELKFFGLSEPDAVLVEDLNGDLRALCGDDAPTLEADYWKNVVALCLPDGNWDSACMERLVRTHPFCPCWAKQNFKDPREACEQSVRKQTPPR